MDGTVLVGVDRTSFVDGLADNINDSAKCLGTDWHHDGMSSVQNCLSSNQTLSGVQSDSAHVVATKMSAQDVDDLDAEAKLWSSCVVLLLGLC